MPSSTEFLKESIDDPRLVAVTGSAADVEKILADRGFDHADYVLSGLPFSTLPPGVGEAIGEATAQVIRPGGAFLVYQFSPKVLDFIKPWFDRIDRGFEWINVPAGDACSGRGGESRRVTEATEGECRPPPSAFGVHLPAAGRTTFRGKLRRRVTL